MGIDELANEYWACLMEAEPTWAHLLGDTSHAGRYEHADRAHEDRLLARLRSFGDQAEALSGLTDDQQVTCDVLVADARNRADLLEARLKQIGVDPVFGPQVMVPSYLGMLGVPDADVAEAMVGKLEGIGRFFDELAGRLEEGVARGRVPAAFAVEGTIAQVERAIDLPLEGHPWVRAIRGPEEVDTPTWREELATAVAKHVRPGLARYAEVLRDVVLPEARPDDEAGLCWLPDGADAYARTLRYYTTTSLAAEEIHELGLEQVAALAEEYRELGAKVLGTDDLPTIFERMRTDPELHFSTGEQVIEASRVALDRAWQAMDDWFEVLPQAPCGVESTTTGAKGFYFPPASDGSRGGVFFLNVTDPTSWSTFELEAIAFHEGVPGHHLQLSIADELPASVPALRKHLLISAYAEGWGLYSERLSDEMGLYSGDLARLGMLAADSLRACRLVVDTGLHALGWSREQAVQYMLDNSPLTRGVCAPEVDRYLVMPGQATSYMIGRLEILRMRREARERQGASFDIKAFHSAVLDSGTLPLDVLDQVVRRRLP